MPRTPPPEGQLTLSDAIKHLHDRGLRVSEGMIYKWVAAGRLKRHGPETRKQKFYAIRELDLVIREELSGTRRPKPTPVLFDIIRREDLPACLRLDQIVYPDDLDLGELGTYQSWRQKNQNISIAAYDASNRDIMLAYIALVPLQEHVILDILRGYRPDHSITVDEVEAYDRPGAYTLLALSAVCHPDRPDLLLKTLHHIMAFWVEQYPERYIKKIYAQSFSERGEMLIQHFFMAPRPDLAYNAYELDLARPSASKAIQRFMKQLKAKAPLPDDLQWSPPAPAPQPATASALPATSITQPTTRKPTVRVSQPQKTASTKPPLPDGWYSVPAFAQRHGIAPTTAKKAITSGRLRDETNDWLSGKAPVRNAFNLEQQAAFIHYYRDERHNENFHQCDVQGCPCHQALNREP